MKQKIFISLAAITITVTSLLVMTQLKDETNQGTNTPCTKCTCPKKKCSKAENPYLDPFNHLTARL
jgi:hypothetical protein